MIKGAVSVVIISILLGSILVMPVSSENTISVLSSNILYVGGSGPGNYTRIQDAIDNATDGDTVFVYGGTYFENVEINTGNISLIGEDRENTTVDSIGVHTGIYISANNITITGLTITNASSVGICTDYDNFKNIIITDNNISNNFGAGIGIDNKNKNITISNNKICNNGRGVSLAEAYSVDVTNNIIAYNEEDGINVWGCGSYRLTNNTIIHNKGDGIRKTGCGHAEIAYNIINNNSKGITIGTDYMIERNIISDNEIGLFFNSRGDPSNKITYNDIINNEFGLKSGKPIFELGEILDSHIVNFHNNNLINNEENRFYIINGGIFFNDNWNDNYWDDWDGRGPYRIKGTPCIIFRISCGFAFSLTFNFDWHPAKEPFDINTGGIE